MKKFLFICLFCIFIVGCNDNNTSSSSISDCPIIDRKFIISFEDTNNEKEINTLPTLSNFFRAIQENIPISKEMEISWERVKENYYIFDMISTDIVTNNSNRLLTIISSKIMVKSNEIQ